MENGNHIQFHGVMDGDVFEIGGVEFVKFPSINGATPAVTKDIVFRSRFGNNNNLSESTVMKKLEEEFLPKIINAVGAKNLCTIQTDLTTLCGLKTYGEMKSLVSLPTLDFYRKNVEIFDKYRIGSWWWLGTPESTDPHDNPCFSLCVSPSGYVIYDGCGSDYIGVRPFLLFVSSIFDSPND